MAISFILLECAHCSKLVLICSSCFKNHKYCSKECWLQVRLPAIKEAKARYRNSEEAKFKQKIRQRNRRARLAEDVTEQSTEKPKLTEKIKQDDNQRGHEELHHGATFVFNVELGLVLFIARCHFCGCICLAAIMPLRGRANAEPWNRRSQTKGAH